MSGKKKAQKMSLSDFLADDTTGGSSWADDVADLPSAPAGKEDRTDSYASRGFGGNDRGNDRYGGDRSYGNDRGNDRYERSERREGGFERREGGFERREGGFEGREQRTYAPRAPVELPTQPPFTAHVANLSFDSTEDDLTGLFANLKVNKIRLLRDRETDRSKGFGYVEFDDLDSLKGALELSGENVQGRTIRINIAEPPRDTDRVRQPDRTDVDTWRRTGPIELPERPARGGFGGRGGFSGRGDTSWGRSGGDSFGSRDRPSERPRLNLKPRTIDTASPAPAKSSGNKPDPFGGARPVDTEKVLHDLEKKHEA